MADVFTTTTTGYGTNLVTLAYDKLIETNLRVLPKFREIADKRSAHSHTMVRPFVSSLTMILLIQL